MGRFILTVSSSPALIHEITESLAGRVAFVEVGTLKANEYHQLPLSDFYQVFTESLSLNHLVAIQVPINQQQISQAWLQEGYPEPL